MGASLLAGLTVGYRLQSFAQAADPIELICTLAHAASRLYLPNIIEDSQRGTEASKVAKLDLVHIVSRRPFLTMICAPTGNSSRDC